MGLTSAHETPQKKSGARVETPNVSTPPNFLDIIRKPGVGTGLKEHERTVDDLKKESFDLRLKVYALEDALRKVSDVQAVYHENENLKALNEALEIELKSLKSFLAEAQTNIEMNQHEQNHAVDQETEIERLKTELSLANNQLTRSITQIKNYEQQLELFDTESLETTRKLKQLELENAFGNKKLAELNSLLQEREGEIKELQEELENKNGFVQQVKNESQALHSELEMLLRQKQELEAKIRIVENERDSIKAEFDPARRRIVGNIQQTPGSPRSSMDLLESRLLRQMGNTSKQLEILTKSNALSQSEKEHLQEQTRRLMSEINSSMRTVMTIFERIANLTGIKPNLTTELTVDKALEELVKMIEAVLNDYDDIKRYGENISADLRTAHEEIAQLKHNNDRLNERARVAQEQLSIVEQEAENSRMLYEKQDLELSKMQKQLKHINDVELARYREQCVTLQSNVHTLETELAAREARLRDTKIEFETQRRRCAELEAELARTSADSLSHNEELLHWRKEKGELLARLATQEDLVAEASKKLDEFRQQLASAERTKARIQDNFEKELRSLHNTNADLKGQLSVASTGKTTNDLRLERLQTSLSLLEQTNEELLVKFHAKEAAYSTIIREHESLVIEKQNLERELNDAQMGVKKAESEIGRLKRADVTNRRGNEGVEHLQHKIESLTSINSILKGQIEAKERALHEAEDKLRRQEDSIRKAYTDCDAQHQKIKKREMVISRVLKRLENINAIAGLGEEDNVLEPNGDGELRF